MSKREDGKGVTLSEDGDIPIIMRQSSTRKRGRRGEGRCGVLSDMFKESALHPIYLLFKNIQSRVFKITKKEREGWRREKGGRIRRSQGTSLEVR